MLLIKSPNTNKERSPDTKGSKSKTKKKMRVKGYVVVTNEGMKKKKNRSEILGSF